MKKILALALSLALAVAIGIGGTLAWLTDTTPELKNTFTVGNIGIDLDETAKNFKMVPGQTIAKDPKVTVKAGSEACYLFVEVKRSENLGEFITYDIAGGWTALNESTHPGVYYREVTTNTNDQSFDVLASNAVSVKNTVTKSMMDKLEDGTRPTLTFTAYAVQQAGFENNLAGAWAQAKLATTTS